jgi:lysozyme
MTISFKNVAEFYQGEPQQDAALDWLDKHCPEDVKTGFEAEWRKEPPAAKSSGERVPKQALDLIKKYEGWREKPYICPAGVATIGYGCTFYPDGRKVSMSDPAVTKAQGEEYLRVVTDKSFVSVLEKTIPNWSNLTDGQKSALISFAYNLGAHFYGDESNFGSITRDLRDKNYSNVPTTLLKYRNPGSAFEEGLRKRRAEEGAIWKS